MELPGCDTAISKEALPARRRVILLTRDAHVLRQCFVDLVQLGLGDVGDALAVVVDPPGTVVLAGAPLVVGVTETVCEACGGVKECAC